MKNMDFQREGSVSNAHVGSEFERLAQTFFANTGLNLERGFPLPVGINSLDKTHKFDLGCSTEKVIVECKSHTWTKGGNVPSAKLTCWNEAMYYFYAASNEYRKIFFMLKDFSTKRGETLAEYYLRTYAHLIPVGVEFWEFDQESKEARHINQ